MSLAKCPDCGRGWDGLIAGERLRQHMLQHKHGNFKERVVTPLRVEGPTERPAVIQPTPDDEP